MVLPIVPKPTPGALAILAIMIGLILFARFVIDRPKPPSSAANAILTGKAQARAFAAEDAQDGDLVDDEAAAGAMWARSHGADDPAECPHYSAAFRKGCSNFVTAH